MFLLYLAVLHLIYDLNRFKNCFIQQYAYFQRCKSWTDQSCTEDGYSATKAKETQDAIYETDTNGERKVYWSADEKDVIAEEA